MTDKLIQVGNRMRHIPTGSVGTVGQCSVHFVWIDWDDDTKESRWVAKEALEFDLGRGQ